MDHLIKPLGGRLTPRELGGEELKVEKEKAAQLNQITMGSRETTDLSIIGKGAFSPLQGFMLGYFGNDSRSSDRGVDCSKDKSEATSHLPIDPFSLDIDKDGREPYPLANITADLFFCVLLSAHPDSVFRPRLC